MNVFTHPTNEYDIIERILIEKFGPVKSFKYMSLGKNDLYDYTNSKVYDETVFLIQHLMIRNVTSVPKTFELISIHNIAYQNTISSQGGVIAIPNVTALLGVRALVANDMNMCGYGVKLTF